MISIRLVREAERLVLSCKIPAEKAAIEAFLELKVQKRKLKTDNRVISK